MFDLPLRALFQSPISFSRAAWSILDYARRTSTFRACAFCEQEGHLASPFSSFQACLLSPQLCGGWKGRARRW
jgi:hypothetical protein